MSKRTVSHSEITEWLKKKVAEEANLLSADVDISLPWSTYGLTSMQILMITGALEQFLQRRVDPSIIWDYPTIKDIAKSLTED